MKGKATDAKERVKTGFAGVMQKIVRVWKTTNRCGIPIWYMIATDVCIM